METFPQEKLAAYATLPAIMEVDGTSLVEDHELSDKQVMRIWSVIFWNPCSNHGIRTNRSADGTCVTRTPSRELGGRLGRQLFRPRADSSV